MNETSISVREDELRAAEWFVRRVVSMELLLYIILIFLMASGHSE